MSIEFYAIIAAAAALIYAGILALKIVRRKPPEGKAREIAKAIREGAMVYLGRQFRVIAVFAVIIAVVLWLAIGWQIGVGFTIGALLSAIAAYISMNIATEANVRTTAAAREGLASALGLAFRGGTVSGMAVVGLGLLGLTVLYLWFRDPFLLIGFGFGASLISLFARVGGGIFTKAADVGADLVGKVEKNIPEDDPRNPAVIADNVGDNVGDCAGMGADLFETYVVTLLAAMLLGLSLENGVIFPLALGGVAIIASIIGTFFVRLSGEKIMGAMYKGVWVAVILSAAGFYFVTKYLVGNMNLFWAGVVGLVVTFLFIYISEYFTATKFKPVQSIAKASKTGAGTNLITGLAVGMKTTAWPVIVIVVGILIAYFLGDVYGIAIAAVAMLSSTGLIIAMDSYGPITDNAGGIAEMSGESEEVRKVTDKLDAVGNTTKATTKGYAIGSAAIATIALFASYSDEIVKAIKEFNLPGDLASFDIANPYVLVGIFIGGMLPFLFSSYTMQAVGRAAFKVVEEVRRQFREKKIMEGQDKPDYGKSVDIVTRAAQKEMVIPGLLAVLSPLAVGFVLGPQALGGMLIGIIATGFLMAINMTAAGGAWDNAKKYIEDGNYGGKGSETHKAAVVGDTVGDPYKDTSGPALNALIKVMNTITIIFALLIAQYHIFG